MNQVYTLGANDSEQTRLVWQARAYGDLETLSFSPNDVVCEIGCGAGATLDIAAQLPDGKYIGVDFLPAQIQASQRAAKLRQLKNTTFICCQGNNTPIATDSVDVAFCRLVLIHQPSSEKIDSILKELQRITKPGGRVIAIEPDVYNYQTNLPILNRLFKERCEYAYAQGRGTLTITEQLATHFTRVGLSEVSDTLHEITVHGHETQRFNLFIQSWKIMVESVISELLSSKRITPEDVERMYEEIHKANADSVMQQHLHIVEGVVA